MSMNLSGNKLKNRRRQKNATFALLLLSAFAVALIVDLPSAGAQMALTFDTYHFVSVRPNPVGVNQPVLIVFWLSNVPTGEGLRGWGGFTISIKKPDGINVILGPFETLEVASDFAEYTPDKVGTYEIQSHFPGQKGPVGDYYKPSDSKVLKLDVQQNQVSYISDNPFPSGYWQRPLNALNRAWYQISGNWLMPAYRQTSRGAASSGWGGEAPYTNIPGSAHVLWTKQIALAGIAGGELGTGGQTIAGNTIYLTPPVIMYGRLYYNIAIGDPQTPTPTTGNVARQAGNTFACVDMDTGETIWTMPGTIDFGQIFYGAPASLSPGTGIATSQQLLWSTGSTYIAYSAKNGNQLFNLTGAQTPQWIVTGPNGEVLVYICDVDRNRMIKWNSTKAGYGSGTRSWSGGIEYNVTIPDQGGNGPNIRYVVPGGQIFCDTVWTKLTTTGPQAGGNFTPIFSPMMFTHIMYDEKTGTQLWATNRTDIGDLAWRGISGSTAVAFGQGVYSVFIRETMQNFGWSVATGQLLWKTDPLTDDWDMYKSASLIADNGILYEAGYAGRVHAYNITTGKHLWSTPLENAGYETPYGVWPIYGGLIKANDKLVYSNGEHSPNTPLYKGEKIHVINAETGDAVWSMTGWFAGITTVLADSRIVSYNTYDGQVYCFFKGKTATTISAPDVAIPMGTPVLIKGTVTDQSPAQKDTPAISDASMSAWMEYLHEQQPNPANAKGVPVKLTAIDPNGNYQNIGMVTSDVGGTYGFAWTPPVPGTYQVTATFEGSESYGSSFATTYFVVTAATSTVSPAASVAPTPSQIVMPTPTPVQTISPSPTPANQPTSYAPTATYTAIAASVVIIVVVAAALILRKRQKR